MSLVEVARFAGLQEAQIVAARLRADGYPVLVQNEYWGGADFTMAIAMGGFRVWAPESEAEDAKALIATFRTTSPDPEETGRATAPQPFRDGVRATLALLVGVLMGWVWALLLVPARRLAGRPVLRGMALVIAACGLAYGLWAGVAVLRLLI